MKTSLHPPKWYYSVLVEDSVTSGKVVVRRNGLRVFNFTISEYRCRSYFVEIYEEPEGTIKLYEGNEPRLGGLV